MTAPQSDSAVAKTNEHLARIRKLMDEGRKGSNESWFKFEESITYVTSQLDTTQTRLSSLEKEMKQMQETLRLVNASLTSTATLKTMVADVGDQYSAIHDEVARQKELQVTMLEQHNDLRLTVHRQQPFIDSVLGAAANLSGTPGPGPVAVRRASSSSNTFRAASPARDDYETQTTFGRFGAAAKRTASMRGSASYSDKTKAFNAHADRSDPVPAPLKRRKARPSIEDSIVYEQHVSNDDNTSTYPLRQQTSHEDQLESPATRRIREELGSGAETAKELLTSFRSSAPRVEQAAKTPKVANTLQAVNSKQAMPSSNAPPSELMPTTAEREHEPFIPAPLAAAQEEEVVVVMPGTRKSAREAERSIQPEGLIDLSKLKPSQLTRALTEDEMEAARP